MINYYKSTNGKISKIDCYEEDCWINVFEPTENEINEIIAKFELETDFVKSALDEEESSRVEIENGNTLIILDTPVSRAKQGEEVVYSTIPVGIIVTPRNVITVSLSENAILTEFSRGFVKDVHTNLKTRFVLQIMLRIVTRFLHQLKQIDKLSSLLERQLRKSMKNKELIELLDVQKSLVYFSTSLKGNETTIGKLSKGRFLKMYEEDRDLLDDVVIELKQAIEMSNIYLNILSGTMDAFASVISNNLNIVMKILASITIVISVPTIISSFYGMNVDGLPLKEFFWFPIVLSGGFMLVLTWILHKKNML